MKPEQKDNHLPKKMRWSAVLLLAGFLLGSLLLSLNWRVQAAPHQAAALDVLINEVAWGGTVASSDDEWIELYSPGVPNFDLTGWRLVAEDGSPDIILSGVTSASGYFLLERGREENVETGDSVFDGGSSNQIFLGALDDSGELLRLRAPDGAIIDTANSNGGAWPNGRLSPASSMERMGTSADADDIWVTNIGTVKNGKDAAGNDINGSPGQANWGYIVTHTSIPPISTPTITPTPTASRTVMINEVAWAGTEASSGHQWIELYNTSDDDINLLNWQITAADGTPTIDFLSADCANPNCTIAKGGYFLLERTQDTVVGIPADLIYTEALEEGGEFLKLISPTGQVVDTANNDGGGWPAGSALPDFGSMERSGVVADGSSAWFTFAGAPSAYLDASNKPINGSPGEANWAINVTATPSPIPTRTPISPTGTPTSYPFQSVVLNEVLPRPGHDWNGDGVVDFNDEYIEIINRGGSPVNLLNWQLDDEYNSGSDPYRIPSITLQSGARIAIFGYTSHISLSDGGDTVRLLNSNSQIVDVLTYTVVKEADQSWCRFPENGFWNPNCFLTPNEENALRGIFIDQLQDPVRFACVAPDTVPDSISLIECGLLGMSIRDENFWDQDRSVLWLTGQNKWSTWFR